MEGAVEHAAAPTFANEFIVFGARKCAISCSHNTDMFPRELSQAEIKMITEKFEGSLASKGLHDDHHQTLYHHEHHHQTLFI